MYRSFWVVGGVDDCTCRPIIWVVVICVGRSTLVGPWKNPKKRSARSLTFWSVTITNIYSRNFLRLYCCRTTNNNCIQKTKRRLSPRYRPRQSPRKDEGRKRLGSGCSLRECVAPRPSWLDLTWLLTLDRTHPYEFIGSSWSHPCDPFGILFIL